MSTWDLPLTLVRREGSSIVQAEIIALEQGCSALAAAVVIKFVYHAALKAFLGSPQKHLTTPFPSAAFVLLSQRWVKRHWVWEGGV